MARHEDEGQTIAPETAENPSQSEAADPESLLGRHSRRAFLAQLGAAGVVATASPLIVLGQAQETAAEGQPATQAADVVPITLRINGKEVEAKLEPRVTLLDALRDHLAMPGTKKGCDHGQCGACTVHVNGRRVVSCLTLAIMHQKDEITTIEGLAQNGQLHPVQQAFIDHDGFQCGYCTPGQIMSATAMLQEPWWGTDDESTREAMYGNICRCGAYNNIVAAVQQARGAMQKS